MTRMSRQRAADASVRGVGASQRMSSLTAASISPRNRSQAVPREATSIRFGGLAHDAEIDVPDGVAGQDEDVGRVQVGVEVAEHEHLVEHVPVEPAHDPVEVVAGRGQPVEVGLVAVPPRDHHLDQGIPSISSVVSTREVV